MTRTRTFKLALLAAAGAAFFVYAWENLQATRLGYGIEGLRREIKDLEDRNNYLKKEIRISQSPERLQAEAMKIGLIYPEPESVVLLDDRPAGGAGTGWFAQLLRLSPHTHESSPSKTGV
ncbi:MAG TPA: hypothetical protein PL037_07365 [Elusimicrobiales bacterium]|nr:hypothetical protein [Elusimicrobiales bacterium]